MDVTQKETERMIRMVNDLLVLSRMDGEPPSWNRNGLTLLTLSPHLLNRFDMIVEP